MANNFSAMAMSSYIALNKEVKLIDMDPGCHPPVCSNITSNDLLRNLERVCSDLALLETLKFRKELPN